MIKSPVLKYPFSNAKFKNTESKFKKQWGKLGFDKMKRPPKDYPSDFEFIDLLMYKSFCTEKFL